MLPTFTVWKHGTMSFPKTSALRLHGNSKNPRFTTRRKKSEETIHVRAEAARNTKTAAERRPRKKDRLERRPSAIFPRSFNFYDRVVCSCFMHEQFFSVRIFGPQQSRSPCQRKQTSAIKTRSFKVRSFHKALQSDIRRSLGSSRCSSFFHERSGDDALLSSGSQEASPSAASQFFRRCPLSPVRSGC